MAEQQDVEINAGIVRDLIERVTAYLDASATEPTASGDMLAEARYVMECMALNAGIWGPSRTGVDNVPPEMAKPPIHRPCPVCGTGAACEVIKVQEFGYGPGGVMIFLNADVPVWRCAACGEFFADWRGRETEPEAINNYLRRRLRRPQSSGEGSTE